MNKLLCVKGGWVGSCKGRVSTRSNLHAGETRAISIISYMITNRITVRNTIINYIRNNTSWLAGDCS